MTILKKRGSLPCFFYVILVLLSRIILLNSTQRSQRTYYIEGSVLIYCIIFQAFADMIWVHLLFVKDSGVIIQSPGASCLSERIKKDLSMSF